MHLQYTACPVKPLQEGQGRERSFLEVTDVCQQRTAAAIDLSAPDKRVAILNVRTQPHDRTELEVFFTMVEELLRELVREAGAASRRG